MIAMHPLAKYLDDKGITQTEFAARIGRDKTTLSKLLSGGIKSVSRELAQAIFRETGGAITPNHLLLEGITIDSAQNDDLGASGDAVPGEPAPKNEAA